MPPSLLSRCVEALRWVWTNDETSQPASIHKIVFTTVLYGTLLALILVVGAVLMYAERRTFALTLWFFGIAISSFLGTVNVAWDVLNYWSERREERSADLASDGPDRELSPNVQVADDTKFGFVVTVLGLIALVVSIRLTFALAALV